MKTSKSPSSCWLPAAALELPLTCTVFTRASLSSPPIALRASASRRRPWRRPGRADVDSKPAQQAAERRPADTSESRCRMTSIIPAATGRASLSAGKEIVKNVKALRSACYSNFPRATLARALITRPRADRLIGALLVLLPALAVLQYRWVGQVSIAERERMQRNLRNAAVQFRDAFDGEVGARVRRLQVGPTTARDGASDRYTDRYETWLETAEHPESSPTSSWWMRRRRRCARAAGTRSAIVRRDAAGRRRCASLATRVRATSCRELRRPSRSTRGGCPGFPDDESLLVAPLRNFGSAAARRAEPRATPVFGFTVVQLEPPVPGRRACCPSWRAASSSTPKATAIASRLRAPTTRRGALPVGSRRCRSTRLRPTRPQSFFGPRARRSSSAVAAGRRGGDRRGPDASRAGRRTAGSRTGPPAQPDESRPLAAGRAARERLARGRGRQRAAAQSGHQLRRAAAPHVSVGAARRSLAPRAAAGAAADGVRGRRLARAAHAGRRDPLGRREPVARRGRQRRPREAIRAGDGERSAAPGRDGRARAAVRGHRIGPRPRARVAAGAGGDHRGSAIDGSLSAPAARRCRCSARSPPDLPPVHRRRRGAARPRCRT